MGVRHGFAVVPRWRGRGALGALLAAALMAGVVVSAEPAAAAPTPSTPAPGATRGPNGELQAPDLVSARTIARLKGEKVEAIGERTATSSTWALPNGTFVSGQASGPIWVRRGGDGTKAGDWAAVDLALQQKADGSISPKAHPADLQLAGDGKPKDGNLVSARGATGQRVGLQWSGELPAPRLEGPRAVYPNVQPGVDLVVEATRTGYEQYFVLNARPNAGAAPTLSLALDVPGASAKLTSNGGVTFTGAEGTTLGSTGTPLAWDAQVDGERQHPVSKPWSATGEAPQPFASMPDWGNSKAGSTGPASKPSAGRPGPPVPDAAANPDPGKAAGQGGSTASVKAGGSAALPLTEAATVTGPGHVQLSLTPDPAYLADPQTKYPVVVDPVFQAGGLFDTWVQTGYSTDQSASPELRLGTYDGGATVARSFIQEDLTALQGKQILGATLELWETYSYSCQARNWQVWATDQASTATRINNQPGWYGPWGTSAQTTGYSAGCAAGFVDADVTSLYQMWVNNKAGLVSMGLRAESETDSYGWKKFNSANAGSGIPIVYITYNTAPTVPDMLRIDPQPKAPQTLPWTSSLTPQLSAVAHDPDNTAQTLTYHVSNITQSTSKDLTAAGVGNGAAGPVTVPKGFLAEGDKFNYVVQGNDGYLSGPQAASYDWFVDTTKPAAPTVTSTDYPSDGTWHGAENQAGSFTLTLPAPDPTMDVFAWDLDKVPTTNRVTLADGAVSTTITAKPTTPGRHVLQVKALDKASNESPIVSYVFYVGKGALTSPLDGAQVARRARLTVSADPSLTYAKFQWRRGPDAATVSDLDLTTLTAANGSALTSAWTKLSDLGGYATWDASSTLGFVAGPVQIHALLSGDSTGSTSFATPWVTVTVTPDAQNAATDSVGPGSVNLLTGDYRMSSTDVDEFGLSVQRTASSRDPRAGLDPQLELLSAAAQKASDKSAFNPNYVTLGVDTAHWHADNNSLAVTPTGASTSSFAYPGAVNSGAITGMTAGKTYRVTGWIYVPAATGLSPGDANGLRIVGMYNDGTAWQTQMSNKPTLTDTWQQLTMDFTLPAGATGQFIRLYNGFSATTKPVYYDDLSVREVWAPFGPQWSLGVEDQSTGTAYTSISQPFPDVAVLHTSDGGEVWFTGGGGNWWPQPGAEGMRLSVTGTGTWRLTELDGTFSDFAVQQGATDAQLVSASPPVAAGQTRLVYQMVNGQSRLYRMIAPIEPGVDGWPDNAQACTTATPAAGCQILELVYAGSTTATASAYGAFAGQVSQVNLWSSPDATSATAAVAAVKYAYDTSGRLREVWDPRITPAALKTTYDYDTDGRVTTLTPPGELPWKFRYGTGGSHAPIGNGDLIDRSSGRLLSVSRASLQPGTVDQTGPDTTTTLVYAVPTTRTAGGPYDLGTDAIATWAQGSVPTDATAIFGPEDVPAVTTATDTTPGPDGYKPATVHYLDSSGREVNTATPSGPDAPVGGFIDTSEYDQYGNVVRSLDATNRLLALGQLPSAATDLATLNLTPADTATRAMELSTLNTYGPEGVDLVRTQGPLVKRAIDNDASNLQLVHDLTTNVYDEAKPDGVAYHLVTTKTDSLLLDGSSPEQLLDVVVTKNGYDPIDGASSLGTSSGWKVGHPTVVIADAGTGGANMTAKVRYDDQGRAVESREAGSTGTDAGTKLTAFYTAGPNAQRPECGNKPGWAGWACVTYLAGPASGYDAARMAAALPVKTVTGYNRYGSVAAVTEAATGPVAGATVTQTRTTTTTYDDADRVTSVQISADGAGTTAAPMNKTVTSYDPTTGHATQVAAVDSGGTTKSTVKKTFDQLGRMTRYEDGAGGWTNSVFDQFGKPTQVTDSIGSTTTFTYDRSQEPRGFVTSVNDSVAGAQSASYGPDGQLTSETLPGGVTLNIAYDAARTPISRSYVRASDGAVVASASSVENGAGQEIASTTDASSKRYSYDRLGRLTDVQDTTTGVGVCTARRYGYNDRSERLSLTTVSSGTSTCADPGNPVGAAVTTDNYVYDTADRLVSESTVDAGAWVYDPVGRITTAPVRGSPGAVVHNAYYANDLVASQTVDGVARQTWSLDATQRFSSYTQEAWANGAWQQAVTKVNHYDSDSDSPAWIAEDSTLPDQVTRYVDGLDGNLAVQTGKTGNRVLQLVDLHGDVMGTVPIPDGATEADWTGLAYQAADEFGNPTDLTTGAAVAGNGGPPSKDDRYGWLGGKQRSADALAGVLLMGVRLYDPATGRFWSMDPVPGGNATTYDYCTGDPVNCTDLDGNFGWGWLKKAVHVVAKVAEVASYIPGPIGAAAAAVSAVAYAADGNKGKAIEMGITAAAAMIPGGGAAAKAGFAAARKVAGETAAKIGRAVVKAARGACNSFAPDTGVLMADGSTVPISQVEVGDLVAARDPTTGELTAQPVLNVIVGTGDKHLISVTTAAAPGATLAVGQIADDVTASDTWVATANHPIWVQGRGWTNAQRLRVGDLTMGATGELRIIESVVDEGVIHDKTVYNLSVANVHTYIVGSLGDGTLVHNSSCPIGGVYALVHVESGRVMRTGLTNNLARREAEHARSYVGVDFVPLYRTNNALARRGLEQMVHQTYRPILNRVNPISPFNPMRPVYMRAAKAFLRSR